MNAKLIEAAQELRAVGFRAELFGGIAGNVRKPDCIVVDVGSPVFVGNATRYAMMQLTVQKFWPLNDIVYEKATDETTRVYFFEHAPTGQWCMLCGEMAQ